MSAAPKAFKPKLGFKVGKPKPLPQELSDITTVVPQPFDGPAAAVAKKEVVDAPPSLFTPIAATAPAAVAPVAPVAPVPVPAVVEKPAEKEPGAPLAKTRKLKIKRAVAKTTAAKETTVDPELVLLQDAITDSIKEVPYAEPTPEPYVPEDRKGFTRFIASRFQTFALPRILDARINPNACSEMKLQTYKYQAFIREYMRQASPYRGVLVYHGLGSGKTCTSIAASEALYGQDDKKIIVMTPASLKENFLNELMFCGFRHYRLKNFWVPVSLKTSENRLFATSVAGLPEKLLNAILRRPDEQRIFWMPDLNKPEEESNYDTLLDWERSAIREQLYAVLESKITFIGYTGFSHERLKDIAVNNPTFFDNAVIIIDEIHNVTRLMAGKLDKYLRQVPGATATTKAAAHTVKFAKKAMSYEPVGVDTWVPKLTSPDQKYERAFLFYRLLVQAKNSKIIALSGTPIVNQPVEFGILSNILHGYFHTATLYLPPLSDIQNAALKKVLDEHIRVNYYKIKVQEGYTSVFFTIMDDGYMKTFNADTGEFMGVIYVGPDYATPSTIQDLYRSVVSDLTAAGIPVPTREPTFEALPLLPPTQNEFTNTFVDTNTFKVKNRITFMKRISGLVSYYRGSKEELMPKVVKDEQVLCGFSALQQREYEQFRLEELEKKPKKKSAWDELADLEGGDQNSYRFKSRAACNFAFPKDMKRPFPRKKKDLLAAVGEMNVLAGDGATDITEAPGTVEEAEVAAAEEAAARAEDAEGNEDVEELEETAATATATPSAALTKRKILSYSEELAEALRSLYARKDALFSMDTSKPENEQLKTYSTKYHEIITRINASKGSSLVYSTFKTVEGIGLLGYALEANGYAPIKITGTETDMFLDEATVKSFTENPGQPRYIMYSGDASVRMRQTLINLFNARLDKLPPKIAKVLRDSGLSDTQNFKGEICRVFMITGAGAEGLSLRNVRTVHIMEPYWNKVRTDQVKGRAVRICSHSSLPYSEDPEENQRTVEVYTYIAQFNKDLPLPFQIELSDGKKTSDAHIQQLADLKDTINSDILGLVKNGAVDCLLNQAENEASITCFVQEGTVSDFLYDPRINEDISMTEQEVKAETGTVAATMRVREIKPKGQEISYVAVMKEDGKELIYAKSDVLYQKPLGELTVDAETKKARLKFYK
jgi:hypothetical protein